MSLRLFVAVLLVSIAFGDVYMHNPRGSNNRLNEQNANRNNGDRLFDSQNNNRGGYNVGDKTDDAFDGATAPYGMYPPDQVYDTSQTTDAMQYQMMYYEGSIIQFEWTNQHACGGNEKLDPQMNNCNIVLQYTCNNAGLETDLAMIVDLRDGGNTNTPDEPNSLTDVPLVNAARGHHESEASYYECKTRKRNNGLFHADQNLNGDDARFTRQNNNGNRRGLECTEERDYYPYWTPTIWRDIAYLTDNALQYDANGLVLKDVNNKPVMSDRCNYILQRSQNTIKKYKCVGNDKAIESSLSESKCVANGGTWKGWQHTQADGTTAIKPLDCVQVGWSRVNHLGNGREGQPLSYNWTLPTFAGDLSSVQHWGTVGSRYAKCVVRLRYNISTDDYNPWNINSTQDDRPEYGIVSPITNNPTVDVGADLQGLRLAINTAQFGRTFQDRSHVFYIKERPTAFAGATIYNLNVRGKRGNIVQTYPSVEYDFMPNRLHLTTNDLLHIQWTGSNTHNNGDPAGDGQAGDAGEGTSGTDRHNFVQYMNLDDNYPIPLDKYKGETIYDKSECYDASTPTGTKLDWIDCALILSTSGYYRNPNAIDGQFNSLLNNAPASLIAGVVMKITVPGQYNYACTRNNNFSNRSQKGVLFVAAP